VPSTFRPGLMGVPRWRTMMEPPGTSCPPKTFTPSRCAFESRPLRELPKPFLCAIGEYRVMSTEYRVAATWQLTTGDWQLLYFFPPFFGLEVPRPPFLPADFFPVGRLPPLP